MVLSVQHLDDSQFTFNYSSTGTKPVTYCGVVVNSKLIEPADMATAEKLGEDLANLMIAKGASIIMEEARKTVTSNISK